MSRYCLACGSKYFFPVPVELEGSSVQRHAAQFFSIPVPSLKKFIFMAELGKGRWTWEALMRGLTGLY